MRRRILFVLLVIGVGVFASMLPSQPARATAQIGFSSTGPISTSYSATVYQSAFTFLTNSTVDELMSVDILLVGSSPMTLNLYSSDAAGNRGAFITSIATVTLGAEQVYSFVPTTPILLQPNSYYWIQTELTNGNFGAGNLPISDYYTFGKSWLTEITLPTWVEVTNAPPLTLRIDTLDTLSASLSCVADDLVVTIPNGDGDFEIRDDSGVLMGNATTGTNTILGPITATNVIITELRGDGESINIGGITCPSGVTTPPTIPSISTVTVLGCALDVTDGVDIANAPDNTYCRILMKDGGVVGYSGAIPRDLISLGVILAVDVYRLEGGQSINTFPDYSRVCLAGQGRLFYMDGRNAPRVSVEMPSQTVDGLTCAWIPAPGTVILTN